MISLKTKRFLISDHEPEDLLPMHSLLSDPKAMYYLQDIKTNILYETKNNLDTAIGEITSQKRTRYFFKIEDAANHEYIGEIGYTVRLDTPLGKVVGLGYFILPGYWGKGIITEAAGEVIRFAFEENDVIKIETGCLRDNAASERVMQKLGMIREAEIKMGVWHGGCLKDRVEYRLLKQEWEDMRTQFESERKRWI